MGVIPEVVKTGAFELRESGFTTFFSVDNQSHSLQVKYYETEKWRKFPRHLKRNVAELCSELWVAAIPAENKIFTHKVTENDIELFKYITYQTQGLYRNRMAYPSIEPRPTLKVSRGDRSWDGWEASIEGCGLYFSGGRDAFCTLGILEEAGYDPQLFMFNNDSGWDAGELARERFAEEDRQVDTIWCNHKILQRELAKDHNLMLHLEPPKFFTMWAMSFPILENWLNFFGNEATTTRFQKVGKDKILHHSWEQSQPTNYFMTKWARETNIPLKVGSVIREMGDLRIMKELVERFPEYDEISRSCFFVNTDDEIYPPCSKCHKCYRNYLTRKAIDADISMYDEERIQKYEMDPAQMMWKTLLPADLSQINRRLDGELSEVPITQYRRMEGLNFIEDRANPTYFLSRDEFGEIYEVAKDDDDYHVYNGEEWLTLYGPNEVYDEITQWDLPWFDYQARVTENNSLLNV